MAVNRHWLQIHLSTAIVLMFVAGGLVYVNMQGREPADLYGLDVVTFGWPVDMVNALSGFSFRQWSHSGVVCNVAAACALLSATALSCEWLLRRRGRKPESSAENQK